MTSCQLSARSHWYSSTSSTWWRTENAGRRSALGAARRVRGRLRPCMGHLLRGRIGIVLEARAGPAARRKGRKRRSGLARLEFERGAVDAVTQAGGLPRPIGKDVAEVSFTAGAAHLRPGHEVGAVFVLADGGTGRRLVEARPARTGLELGGGGEQRLAAAHAAEGAGALFPIEWRGARRLGAVLAGDVVLLGGQLAAPLGIRLDDFVGSDRGLLGHGTRPGVVESGVGNRWHPIMTAAGAGFESEAFQVFVSAGGRCSDPMNCRQLEYWTSHTRKTVCTCNTAGSCGLYISSQRLRSRLRLLGSLTHISLCCSMIIVKLRFLM